MTEQEYKLAVSHFELKEAFNLITDVRAHFVGSESHAMTDSEYSAMLCDAADKVLRASNRIERMINLCL